MSHAFLCKYIQEPTIEGTLDCGKQKKGGGNNETLTAVTQLMEASRMPLSCRRRQTGGKEGRTDNEVNATDG